jgi:hypothetical protein
MGLALGRGKIKPPGRRRFLVGAALAAMVLLFFGSKKENRG